MVSASETAVVFRAQHALHAPCQLEWDAGKSSWPTTRTRGETRQVSTQGSALPHSWTRPRSKGAARCALTRPNNRALSRPKLTVSTRKGAAVSTFPCVGMSSLRGKHGKDRCERSMGFLVRPCRPSLPISNLVAGAPPSLPSTHRALGWRG
jgi:hypothetical protein